MSNLLSRFPAHNAALHLTHNQHKSGYETVSEAIQSGTYPERCWVSPEQMAKAIAEDSVWELQWYPNTPVSFIVRIACDLEALLEPASRAAPAPAEQVEGWQLVPKQSTREMQIAGRKALEHIEDLMDASNYVIDARAIAVWEHMLAAAPVTEAKAGGAQ